MEKVQTDAFNEIKSHLEVEINGVDQSRLSEWGEWEMIRDQGTQGLNRNPNHLIGWGTE